MQYLVSRCDQCKKQDFDIQEALHHQNYVKVKAFCRSTDSMVDKATHASQTVHGLHVFRCAHVELLKKKRKKKKVLKVI